MRLQLPPDKLSQAGPVSPIVMVTCVDAEGRANIITLGMYMTISSKPPLVCIGVAPQRYSHDLISEQREFTVNVPSIDLKDKMHFCGTNSGRDVYKFKETGLTPISASKIRSPLIEECYGHLECKVVGSHTYGDHTLFVGEVVAASVDEELFKNGRLDIDRAKPIAQKNWDYRTLRRKK